MPWLSIAAAWAAQGFDVTVHCYDAYATLGMKLRNKGLLELPQKAGVDRTAARVAWDTGRAVAALREAHAGHVAAPPSVDDRRRQRAQVAEAHAKVYESVVGRR